MQELIDWFDTHKRSLPWRESPTPYQVWISEVMLQQTQVAVVIPYYERWMNAFPTIEKLAEAPIEKVMKLWEGLGYYSRVRNLHEGAKKIVHEFGGQLPDEVEQLKTIKGLGPYTIGAILSFAFHKRAAAVDGNVIRVLTRYFNMSDDISRPATVKKIWNQAEAILPENRPWAFSEALIELGATICTKKRTRCLSCPIQPTCQAYAQQTVDLLPYKSKKIKMTPLYRAVAIVHCEDLFLIKKGEKGKVMEGLYEFPYIETEQEGISSSELQKQLSTTLNISTQPENTPSLKEEKHGFTRYQVSLRPVMVKSNHTPLIAPYEWVHINDLHHSPFSSGHKKILQQLYSRKKS
jgi:A/G-specific adenine glycosylase